MEWVDLIQKVGFPIVVAGWFMLRLEKRLDRMAELQSNLMQAISLLAKAIDGRMSNELEQRRRNSVPPPLQLDAKKELP